MCARWQRECTERSFVFVFVVVWRFKWVSLGNGEWERDESGKGKRRNGKVVLSGVYRSPAKVVFI